MNSLPASKPTRPLSPHLQIYKPQLTTVMSILHRATGLALTFGTVVFVAWLMAVASGFDAYTSFIKVASSLYGQIILFGLTASFFYHFCCGIRHLLWDAGFFLEIKDVYRTGRIVFVVALILTLIVWLDIYGVAS